MVRLFPLLLILSISLAETKTVAISYFDNTSGLEQYNPLSKGLADMLITDLSNVKSIQIVEREKLESLLKEIDLGKGKFIDPNTAQKLGKGLGADIILTGAFLSMNPDMRIDARLIEVGTGKVLGAKEVTGRSSDFFKLEKQLALILIEHLNVQADMEETAPQKIDLGAVLNFSEAIELSDKGFDYEASDLLQKTVEEYPEFYLAQEKLNAIKGLIISIDNKRKTNLKNQTEEIFKNINADSENLAKNYAQLLINLSSSSYWSQIFSLNRSLESIGQNIMKKKYDGVSLEELILWYDISYYDLFQNHQKQIVESTKFLQKFPFSKYYVDVKSRLEKTIDDQEKTQKAKEDYENLKIIASYILDEKTFRAYLNLYNVNINSREYEWVKKTFHNVIIPNENISYAVIEKYYALEKEKMGYVVMVGDLPYYLRKSYWSDVRGERYSKIYFYLEDYARLAFSHNDKIELIWIKDTLNTMHEEAYAQNIIDDNLVGHQNSLEKIIENINKSDFDVYRTNNDSYLTLIKEYEQEKLIIKRNISYEMKQYKEVIRYGSQLMNYEKMSEKQKDKNYNELFDAFLQLGKFEDYKKLYNIYNNDFPDKANLYNKIRRSLPN